MKRGMLISDFILGILVLALLIGCGPTLGMRAWKELEKSKAAYKECLMTHSENPDKCEGLRKAYEADVKAYRAIMGRSVTIEEEVTIEKKK